MKTLSSHTPHLIMVVGVPGSGKSTFGERFADTFSAPFLDPQAYQTHGVAPENMRLFTQTFLDQVGRTKKTIVCEPITGTRSERSDLIKWAKAHDYTPLIVWLQTDPAVAKTRAQKKSRAQKTQFDETAYEHDKKRFSTPHQNEPYIVVSGMHTYASQARVVLKRIGDNSPRNNATPTAPPRRPQPQDGRRAISIS